MLYSYTDTENEQRSQQHLCKIRILYTNTFPELAEPPLDYGIFYYILTQEICLLHKSLGMNSISVVVRNLRLP